MVDTGVPGCDFSYAGGTDCGWNVQTKTGATVFSEMAHLFYLTLGNKAVCPPGDAACSVAQPGWGLSNTGDFQNMQSGVYWSGLRSALYPGQAWPFYPRDGGQYVVHESYPLYALAVHPGDVTAAVPEPEAAALMLIGLAALALAWRRRVQA